MRQVRALSEGGGPLACMGLRRAYKGGRQGGLGCSPDGAFDEQAQSLRSSQFASCIIRDNRLMVCMNN